MSDNFEKEEANRESSFREGPKAISQPLVLSSMLRQWCRSAELTAMLGKEQCKMETGVHTCEPLNINVVAYNLGNAILDLMLLIKWANKYAVEPVAKAKSKRPRSKTVSAKQKQAAVKRAAKKKGQAKSAKVSATSANVIKAGTAKRIEKGKIRIRQAMENISEEVFGCKFYMPLWTQVVLYVRQELAKEDDSDECLQNPHPLSLETFVAAGKKIKEALDLKLSQRTLITAGFELRRIFQEQGKQIPTPDQMEWERKNKRAQQDA